MYTSQELRDMALEAPSDTLEETVERLCQKQITQAQLEYRDKCQYVYSEEFAQRFYHQYHKHPNVDYLFEAQINKTLIELQNKKEQEIEALYALRDYRLGNLHST